MCGTPSIDRTDTRLKLADLQSTRPDAPGARLTHLNVPGPEPEATGTGLRERLLDIREGLNRSGPLPLHDEVRHLKRVLAHALNVIAYHTGAQ